MNTPNSTLHIHVCVCVYVCLWGLEGRRKRSPNACGGVRKERKRGLRWLVSMVSNIGV